MVTKATEIVGRKPQGVPVAIPISVDVSDAELSGDRLRYYVLAELPSAAVFEQLKKLDDERQKLLAAAPQSVAPKDPSNGTALPHRGEEGEDIEQLSSRVDALEQRLDLITRQLNEVLKRIER